MIYKQRKGQHLSSGRRMKRSWSHDEVNKQVRLFISAIHARPSASLLCAVCMHPLQPHVYILSYSMTEYTTYLMIYYLFIYIFLL